MSTQPIEKFLYYICENKIKNNECCYVWITKNHLTMSQPGAIYVLIEKIGDRAQTIIFDSFSQLHSHRTACKKKSVKFDAEEIKTLDTQGLKMWRDQYFHIKQHKIYVE